MQNKSDLEEKLLDDTHKENKLKEPLFENYYDNQEISDSDIDIETDETFETLKQEFLEPTTCIRNVYRKYFNLFTREGLSIYVQNKKFIEEKNITLYKAKKNKLYICKYCKSECSINRGQKFKSKELSIKDLAKIICQCPNDDFRYLDREEKKNDLGTVLLRTKSIFPHEVRRIYDKFYELDSNERANWLNNEFERVKKNQDLQLDIFINIFFDKVNQYFEVEKGLGISTLLNLGIEIFIKFKLYETRNDTDLKKRAFLTFFLMLLIKNNSSIFSINRNILYESVPSDFLFYTYAYKKRKIFKNNEVKENLTKCNLFLRQMFDYFFSDETHFNLGRETNSYDPVDFLIENAFFVNDYFSSNSEKTKFHFLNLREQSVNSQTSINANNIIVIFDEFLKKGKSDKKLYIDKDDYLSKELLEKEIRKKLEFDIEPNQTTISQSRLCIFLIDFLDFESKFLDVNKEKVLNILSLYSSKKRVDKSTEKQNLKKLKKLPLIFNEISRRILKIVSTKEGYYGYQDLSMIIKTLDYFQITEYQPKDIFRFNFKKLIQEIIDAMILEKLATKLENVHRNNQLPDDEKFEQYNESEDNKDKIEELFIYILKLMHLLSITVEGKIYLYNSTFMEEIIQTIIYDINYKNPSFEEKVFFIDLLIFIKLNFNRKIISRSLYNICGKDSKNILLKIFFLNDPVKNEESMYDFKYYYQYTYLKVKDYYYLFEKEESNILYSIFNRNQNPDISYAEGLKYLLLYSIEEDFDCIFDSSKDERTEESRNRYRVLSSIVYLSNLIATDFFLPREEKLPFFNNEKYDLLTVMKNKKIPFFTKSLFLEFLVKYTLIYKVDKNSNIIEMYPYSIPEKREEYETNHLNNIVILLNIFYICLEMLEDITPERFSNAYIEKNGLYDFCFSLINGINCFNNFVQNILVRNDNESESVLCDYFNRLLVAFLKNRDSILQCFNLIPDQNDYNIIKIIIKELKLVCGNCYYVKRQTWYEKIFQPFNEIFKQFHSIIYNNLNEPALPEVVSIYDKFKNFNGGNLFSANSDDAYSYLYRYKQPEINIEDIETYKINEDILENYKKWCDFIEKEGAEDGIDIVLNAFDNRMGNYTIREYFFVKYFLKVIPNFFDDFFNDVIVLNGFIKLIISDKKLIDFENLEEKKEILEKYSVLPYNESEIKAKIIGTLIRKLNQVCNYEISISTCFCNTKHEIQLSGYVNSLILFIQVLGENFNLSFHEAMFEYQFNLDQKGDNNPVAKFNEQTKTYVNIPILQKNEEKNKNDENDIKNEELFVADIDINKGCPPYLVLLILHQKIFDLLYEMEKKDIIQENLIIIFHSLTTCLEEFSHVKNKVHEERLSYFYKDFFRMKKIRILVIHYNKIKDLKKDEKLDFITNDLMVLLNVYLTNDKSNLIEFYKDDADSCDCFWEWLAVHYFKQTLLKLGVIDDITQEHLYNLYNEKKLEKISTFHLLLKYYEMLYILAKDYNLTEFEFLFEKEMNTAKLSKYIAKCKEQYGITVESENEKKESEIRKLMYSFLNKIFIDLEIKFEEEGESVRAHAILASEINYLSEETKKNYLDGVDRTSADTKLFSIYENIDSILFEMIYNAHKIDNSWEIKNYTFLENVNFLFILIYNCILVYLYYKSTNQPLEIYNQIDNYKYHLQNNYILPILTICHFIFLIFVFFSWHHNNFIVKYYFDLCQYNKDNVTEKDKLNLDKKAKLYKELIENYSTDISRVYEFFPGIPWQNKIEICIINTLLLNYTIMPFLVTLFCLIFYYIFSQIFLIVPILLFAKFVPTLSAIFTGLAGKFKYLLTVYIYTFTTLYIFSWAGFLFIPKMFNKDVIFFNDTINPPIEEAMCSSSVQCILYFLNFGLTEGNAGMDVLSYKDDINFYFKQFVFDLCYNLLVNMIFANIFTGLITDAFGENREKAWSNEIDKEEKCFICQITKSECVNSHKDFKEHREDHSVWKYIYFLSNILLKEQTEFNSEEQYVYDKMKELSFDWFPTKEDDEDELRNLLKEESRKAELERKKNEEKNKDTVDKLDMVVALVENWENNNKKQMEGNEICG